MAKDTIVELVTHGGSFHVDEVLATVVLQDLFPAAETFRSRDPDLTSAAPGRIVYDVGRAHDPIQRLYDHHQPNAARRACGTRYSAFGLIWRDFGRDWLEGRVPATSLEAVYDRLDRELVLAVDAVDNGVVAPAEAGIFAPITLFTIIEDCRPSWKDDGEIETTLAFDRACAIASVFLENRTSTISAEIEAAAFIRDVLANSKGPIVELPANMPWHGAVFEPGAKHILVVIHPRADGNWVVSAIPQAPGSYANRLDLPEAWAGLQGEDLQAASGIASAVFCHAARFMAVAGTGEDAMQMARKAIEMAKPIAAPDPF